MDHRAAAQKLAQLDHSCNPTSAPSCSSPGRAAPVAGISSPNIQSPHLVIMSVYSRSRKIIDSAYLDNDQSLQPPAHSGEVLQHCLQHVNNSLDHPLQAHTIDLRLAHAVQAWPCVDHVHVEPAQTAPLCIVDAQACNTTEAGALQEQICPYIDVQAMQEYNATVRPRMQAQVQATRPCIDHHVQAQAAYFYRPRMMQREMNDQNSGYSLVRMQSCLPPMSSALITCIAGVRARVARCRSVWRAMQLVSTVSQMVGVLLVLSLCAYSKEERLFLRSSAPTFSFTSSPLPAWALGYALGCLASLPLLFCRQAQAEDDDLVLDDSHNHDNSVMAATERLRNYIDFFFAIWFVMGIVWVFGRSSWSQGNPKLYSLCVTLLMLNGFRYMMPLFLCCALCCCLQPRTSSMSDGIDHDYGDKGKGVTQEQIDAMLPVFKFKCRRPIIHSLSCNENYCNFHDETFPLDKAMLPMTTTTMDQISMDGLDCCICLKRYKENARLRGLPCSHYFHIDCVDKWLKVNASCPLCKFSLKENELHHFPLFSRWRLVESS